MSHVSGPNLGGLYNPPDPLALQFRHRATIGVNFTAGQKTTRLDHPALNGNPAAIVTVTPIVIFENQRIDNESRLIEIAYPAGVNYGGGHWFIYSMNEKPFVDGAEFNVAIHEARRPA